MKKIILSLFFVLNVISTTFAQTAKKPTITILPSDAWCQARYYTKTFDNQGSTVKVADYPKAFQQDNELRITISTLGQMLNDMGYSLKDAEMEFKHLTNSIEEDNATYAKKSGSNMAESDLDVLKRRTKADILIMLTWTKGSQGFTFTIEAFDCYTSKRIATSVGIEAKGKNMPEILINSVKKNLPKFDEQLSKHYMDQEKNGREIVFTIRRWADWDKDLETDFDGNELHDIIEDWMHENTVGDVFNLSDATENVMEYEQVRIPMFDTRGRSIDARSFCNGLKKKLQESYNIPGKIIVKGLGEVLLVLGEQ